MKLFVRFVTSEWDLEQEFLTAWANEKLIKECDKFSANTEEHVSSCIWIHSFLRFNTYITH